ncbi:hypothetical protein B0T13DRAFT_535423 [Neurospora crassa]|nr:hypothetical protein B0T13DRAFT_535423 [Neurospora crassa]
MARLSGLQKEVLGLYRKCLRECRKKPEATRAHFRAFARTEFEKNIKVDKRDFSAIEFLLRKGSRQLEIPSVARRAAEQVFRKPLSLSLQKLRRAQAKRHATKVHVSFVRSNGSQNRLSSGSSRKRSSYQRRKPSPPKRGNGGAIPVIWQDIDYKGGPRQLDKSHGSYAKVTPHDASSSQEDQHRHCCLGSPSEKHAVKPPGTYWGELPESPVKPPPKVPKPPAKEPLLHISRDKRSVIKLQPLPPLPEGPSAPMPKPRPSPGTPTPRGKAPMRPAPVRPGASQLRKLPLHAQTWVPPETWGSTNRQLKPHKKGSGSKDRAHPSSSNSRHIVPRFCNRRKASNRSIESQEAQSKGGTSNIPDSPADVGETHGSNRTVNELLPYRDQFREAGLAVTSKEQKAYHRRGKLAPLLGKMSPPGSEWLRLDGGTETKELIDNKKDDSPSPINVEQISQKSGEDKLSNASLSPPPHSTTKPEAVFSNGEASSPERQPPSIPDEGKKGNTLPTTTPPPAPKPAGIPNSDKSLPALPRVSSQVLVRHGSGPSRNSSWSAAKRQFPPTIVEQKEPSPDKQQKQKLIHHGRQQNTTITPSIRSAATTTSYGTAILIQPAAKSYGQLLIRNTKRNSVSEATVITKTPPRPSVVSSIEVPESVRTGTLSCLDQALDEAVRRMQAMGESVATSTPLSSSTIKTLSKSKSKPNKATGEHQRSTSSKTAPSPSQRLQKAAALRRQKMVLSGTCAVGGRGSHSPRSKPPSLASTVEREEEQGAIVKTTTTFQFRTVGVGFY